uniref:HDC02233 n=1 Tax=Drosophila melanogaster TaxID=7227 RepID=Q6IHM1_DROME|nr:TPA_inf: HDC02233 [Drosophila melanogaster]
MLHHLIFGYNPFSVNDAHVLACNIHPQPNDSLIAQKIKPSGDIVLKDSCWLPCVAFAIIFCRYGIEVFATLLMNMLVGHSHVTETSRERGLLPKGVWRARRVTMRQCVVKCARLSRGSPKGDSINLFPDGAWSRIGGVGASTSCWGTGGGMEQKLTLTGLTRLRTSVETVARKADGWSGGAHNCGVDDDGAPSSLVRNA